MIFPEKLGVIYKKRAKYTMHLIVLILEFLRISNKYIELSQNKKAVSRPSYMYKTLNSAMWTVNSKNIKITKFQSLQKENDWKSFCLHTKVIFFLEFEYLKCYLKIMVIIT